jgi:hypothetical protein
VGSHLYRDGIFACHSWSREWRASISQSPNHIIPGAEPDIAGTLSPERLAEILNAITLDDYETVFAGKSTADFTSPAVYEALVGNFAEARFPHELEPPDNHFDCSTARNNGPKACRN